MMKKNETYFDTFVHRGRYRITQLPQHFLKKSMMKNYLLNLRSLSLLGMIMASVWWNMALAQCGISGPAEGCEGDQMSFTATGVAPGDAVSWQTNTAGTATGGSANFTFGTPGTESIKITVTGSVNCTFTFPFQVNAKPTGNFVHQTVTPQCYTGNLFCFKDVSTAGTGRSFTSSSVEFLYGDGVQDFTSGPGTLFCHSYPDQNGGDYQPIVRVTNDKGCKDDYFGPWIRVKPDLQVDFKTTAKAQCGQTVVPFQNTSTIAFNRVKKFHWDFGDGTTFTSGSDPAVNLCYWTPTHTYTQHGCFNVLLLVEDDSGCKDTAYKTSFICNINPSLAVQESSGKDAQCHSTQNFIFTHNINPGNWPVTFLWVFDDPNSGLLNFDNRNFQNAPHKFTAPDIYTVTISGTMAGCPFNGFIDVLVKGPGATIESKAIPDLIADSQRHQCQIKDTVYFKNNSGFFANDDSVLNDTVPGAASILLEDNIVLVTLTNSVKLDEKILDVYVWDGDSLAVIERPLLNAAHNALIKHDLVMFDNFFGVYGGERQDDHIKIVWDFGDNTAPQCTTWTKHKQNVWNNGKWMNCNFSRDIKPKHWYTPGEEQCYTVRLEMKDTTFRNNEWIKYPNGGTFNNSFVRFGDTLDRDTVWQFHAKYDPVTGDTLWNYNPACAAEKTTFQPDLTKAPIFVRVDSKPNKYYPNPNFKTGEECPSENTVLLALEPPLATGMKVKPANGVFCLGSNPTYGVNFDWSETKPGCTRQFVWMNFDSLLDRLDASPKVLDKWTPQQGFLLNPTTPWPLGTLNLPQWPNQIYYDYTGKIADSCGRITVGLRIQNGKSPGTGLPCIDEKWYHEILNYVNSDPEFTLDTVYGCSPLEIELTFNREYMDSLESLVIGVNKDFNTQFDASGGFLYIDSVHRNKFDPVTGTLVSYVLSYHVDDVGNVKKIDSFTFVSGAGGVLGCGSELKIKRKRKLTLYNPGRWQINATANTTEGCANVSSTHYAVIGFEKQVAVDRTLICKNEQVNFIDTALYLLLEPDPLTGAQYIPYNYWRDQNRFQHPDGSFRTPTPRHETTNWDFDQGTGFTTLRFNPIPVTYFVPGHYTIRAEFIDSVGCKDTLTLDLDVTGATANFNFTINIGNCKPIINFFDSSRVYDPCRITKGTGCDSVIRWIWDFGDGSPIVNTTSDAPFPPIKNPSHLYQRFGDFDVKLIVETRMGCFDTLVRTVSVAGPMPKFDFTIDSMGCVPYTVYLGNFSLDPSPNSEWTWFFGDSANTSLTTTSDTVVYFTYTKPGKYRIVLLQNDIVPLTGEKCNDSFPVAPKSIEVTVLPEKKVDFIVSKLEVCPNEIITFTDTSDTTYSTFIWDFDDGNVLTLPESQGGRQVTHSYTAVGDYVVRLRPDYIPAPGEPKCPLWRSILVKVRDVNANFSIDSSAMPLFKFTNLSTNGKEYWWRFGDGDQFTKCPQVDPVNCPNAQHNYGDNKGTYDVCLVVLSPEGCYDTTCATVENRFETSINIPNVFTPDGDGFNDQFIVDIKGWSKYEIKIYNRFSEKVYEHTDPMAPWNGKMNGNGADLPAGVYYVVITYQLRGDPEQTYNGTVTLIRK